MRLMTSVKMAALATGFIAALAVPLSAAEIGGLTPPPAINLPSNARIITDLNFSDNDVLGLIKQILPKIGAVASNNLAGRLPQLGLKKQIDVSQLTETIEGIRNLRILVAHLVGKSSSETFFKQIDQGVAKVGKFRKIVSDASILPGYVAVYVQEDQPGLFVCFLEPNTNVVYAARIMGTLDAAKLIEWGNSLIGTHVPEPDNSDTTHNKPCSEEAKP